MDNGKVGYRLGTDRTKEGSVGTYDGLVNGLLQFLLGDCYPLIVADL